MSEKVAQIQIIMKSKLLTFSLSVHIFVCKPMMLCIELLLGYPVKSFCRLSNSAFHGRGEFSAKNLVK